ncbi:MAG: hypothetical protein ACLSHU_09670 [Oscillospiraceae bacterium]
MKQTAIVNIYHFVRMSHVEPSRFIADDFETIRNEIILTKQHGFPGTYALKYDALMDSRYQALFQTYLDEQDEISAWWEITEPLCRRAGVPFRGRSRQSTTTGWTAPTVWVTGRRSGNGWWMPTWRTFSGYMAGIPRPSAPGCWIL